MDRGVDAVVAAAENGRESDQALQAEVRSSGPSIDADDEGGAAEVADASHPTGRFLQVPSLELHPHT